jgi:hypothetical protein
MEFLIKIIFGLVLVLAVLCFKIWLWGSLATSGVKAIAGSCGKTYGIESIPMINGNWFCLDN